MTIEITVQNIRDVAPELEATDAAINMFITLIGNKVDVCLEASYDEPTAEAIKIYSVAFFAESSANNKGSVTSQKWADGDAQSYAAKEPGENNYWDMVLMLDSARCVQNAFQSGKFFAATGRTSTYKRRAV